MCGEDSHILVGVEMVFNGSSFRVTNIRFKINYTFAQMNEL
tara:strand:+ start:6222 stop:6344 length:123 start_codon:yes stop_codon:yes gene_type:complete